MKKNQLLLASEDIKLKLRIGSLLFNIFFDSSFFNSENETSGSHNHATFELHFIMNGSCTFCVEDLNYELSENSFCIIAPEVYHSLKSNPQCIYRKSCFKFEYTVDRHTENLSPSEETAEIIGILSNIKFFHMKDASKNICLINDIYKEFEEQSVGYISKIQSLFVQILIDVFRLAYIEPKNQLDLPSRIPDEKRIYLIESFFFNNYSRKITDSELSDLLHISSRQLNRILHKLFHSSFREKLCKTRIEAAKDLLTSTNQTISEISIKTGYTSISSFCSVFKFYTGLTPSLFRNKNKL
ncbi:MAG: AraC family transcriptional regulator [Clostridiales bacterium]|nr:AraC family transcriptional regulator [Clostridiales bacterium]